MERSCVECFIGMFEKDIKGIKIDVCPSCKGVFLDKKALRKLRENNDDFFENISKIDK